MSLKIQWKITSFLKISQTGPTSHVSSESRHQWQVHTPVSDILDSEKIKYEFHHEIKEEGKGKEGQDSQEEAGDCRRIVYHQQIIDSEWQPG